MSFSPTAPVDLSLPQLRNAVNGRVLAPADAGYDQARTVFVSGYDRRPTVIVQAADASDVAHVVALARDTDLELAVRSGGHSTPGYGVSDEGITLDLSHMKQLDIDVERRTAWAQTGLTAGEYTTATGVFGLATGFGDTGSVGIGGITLGGGIGFLVRKYGMTVDDLLAAEVVTADGRQLRVDAEQHPDLFWALRGGGGNFGVATRFMFRLHEVDTVVGGMLLLPATHDSITSFVAAAEAAPDELSAIVNIMVAPPMPFVPAEHHGKLVMMIMLAHTGPTDAGERAVAPFRALATPIIDTVAPTPYPALYQMTADGPKPVRESARSLFIDTVDRHTAEKIIDHLQASTAQMAVAQLRVLGGAMARVPVDATAFAHRQRRIIAAVGAVYERHDETEVHDDWATGFVKALHQGTPGVYVNFLSDEGPARIREAYPGSTWDRLTRIKARYDPTNLFHRNQNIPPAPGG